jgi:hypothetical protein
MHNKNCSSIGREQPAHEGLPIEVDGVVGDSCILGKRRREKKKDGLQLSDEYHPYLSYGEGVTG